MLAALIIVFREVFEAGLIIGIVLAVTGSVPHRNRWIVGGVVAGTAAACVVAAFAGALSQLFAGMGQELFNAAILSVAVMMLTWHNVWMARHGREMAGEMRAVGQAVADGTKSLLALAVVVGVAVLREGSEVALFLYGVVASDGGSAASLAIGGFIGLALGAAHRPDYVTRGRHGGAGCGLPRTRQLAHAAQYGGLGQCVADFGHEHRRPGAAYVDWLHGSADGNAAFGLCRRTPRDRHTDAADRIATKRPRRGSRLTPAAAFQEPAVMTCAWIIPSTGPVPNRALILLAAASVASTSRLASRASISLRSGVP